MDMRKAQGLSKPDPTFFVQRLPWGFTVSRWNPTPVKFLPRKFTGRWVVVHVVPGEPRRVRADVVNSTAIRVQWRAPDTSSDDQTVFTAAVPGVVRGYRVYVSVDGSDPSTAPDPPRDTANPEATDLIVDGLRPDTTYLVHAAAYTRRGDGQPSRTVKVRTKGAGYFSSIHLLGRMATRSSKTYSCKGNFPEKYQLSITFQY